MREPPRRRSPTEVRRARPSESQWWFRTAVATLAVLVLAGCGPEENSFNDTERHYLRQRLAATVPQLDVSSIDAGGNGFTTQYGLSVKACPKRTVGVARVRAQLRKTARVLWNHADTYWDELDIGVQCGGGRETADSKPPSGMELHMSAAGAKDLWGEPTKAEHQPEMSPTTIKAARGGAGAEFRDGGGESSFSSPKGYDMYGPHPQGSRVPSWTIHIPYHTSKQARQTNLNRVVAKLWHDHPARLRGIALHAIAKSPPERPDDRKHRRRWEQQRPDWHHRYSAQQLRAKFGPRADDLPQ